MVTHPKSISLSSLVGDSELQQFASEVDRPLIIAGNGPSAAPPPYDLLPKNPLIFRANWFFLEDHYHFGRHVDAWFQAIRNEELEARLRSSAIDGDYDYRFLAAPAKIPGLRHDEEYFAQLYDLGIGELDSWSITARNPKLARMCMSRPLPTTGMQMLAFALGVGFRDIYLSGIDLYESSERRYGWQVPPDVAAALSDKDLVPGYEDRHSLDVDLQFLEVCLAEFPQARIWNVSDSTNLARLLDRPKPFAPGESFLDGETPALCEPRERFVVGTEGIERRATFDGAKLWTERNGKKVAFVTLVSGDFHHGARALANSLRRVTTVPLIALCTGDADRGALMRSGIHCLDVPEIVNPNALDRVSRRFESTYAKLNVFRLTFLDRVVYLDADTIVCENIDDLFDGDGLAAVPDEGIRRAGDLFNSGVLALDPSSETFHEMLDNLGVIDSYDGGDQGFLNQFFDRFTPLGREYNTTKRIEREHPNLSRPADVKVLHYTGVKPWQPEGHPSPYSQLNWEWLDYLARDELRDLVVGLRAQVRAEQQAVRGARALAKRAVQWLRTGALYSTYKKLLKWSGADRA